MIHPRHDWLRLAAFTLCLPALGLTAGIACSGNAAADDDDQGAEGSTAAAGGGAPTGGAGGATNIPDPPPDGPVFVGGERATEVFVPAGYDHNTPTPLLIVLHGYTASGALMNSYLALRSHADERGFLYVTPDGTTDANGSQFWNASDACCDFLNTGVDDSAYLRQVIDETGAIYHVDDKRVFILGHSNGGFMAYRMACDHADAVAAVASLAGAMPMTSCTPSEPLAGLQIHGTSDETVLYDGGVFGAASYPSAEATSATFAQAVGCTGSPEALGTPFDLDASIGGAETNATRHGGCPAGGAAELWTVAGAAHVPAITDDFMPLTLDFLFAKPKP